MIRRMNAVTQIVAISRSVVWYVHFSVSNGAHCEQNLGKSRKSVLPPHRRGKHFRKSAEQTATRWSKCCTPLTRHPDCSGCPFPPHTSRALGSAAREDTQELCSKNAQGNPQDTEATSANLWRKECRGIATRPEGQAAPPHKF